MAADLDLEKYLFKEVDIIEDIVRRMAYNSFLIKGWTITLVVITLLLKGIPIQTFIAFIPLLTFWFLDAYYLQQERLYRRLYVWVCVNRMNTSDHLLSMNAYRFATEEKSKFQIMFSISLLPFYGSILILMVAYIVVLTYSVPQS